MSEPKKWLRRTLTIAGICCAAAGLWLVQLLWSAGAFKTIEPHFSGSCTPVAGVAGPEDITVDPDTGLAYISVCDRRALQSGKSGQGKIFGYDLTSAEPRLVDLTPHGPPDFQPHGISLFKGPDGKKTLMVIDHGEGLNRVRIFAMEGGRLTLKRSLADPLLTSPNDLVAVAPDRFYVTNDHGNVSGILRTMEDYLKLKNAYVLYFDGLGFSVAAENIGYANGIRVSRDGKSLYLTAVTEKALHLYHRDPDTGTLVHAETIDLDTGVDNIELDDTGDLWIGAHPQMLKFLGHAKSPANLSPSQVLRVSLRPGSPPAIKEIYLNRGDPLSGSSVAAVWRDQMLIGAVFEPLFLRCRRSPSGS